MRGTLSLITVAMFALSACNGEKTAATSKSPGRDSSGVKIVENAGDDIALPWKFTEIRRMGGADTGAFSFNRVSRVTVATDGRSRIAVLDWDAGNRIRLFDSTGVSAISVGGRGGGPGEMQGPQGITMDSTGRILVHDFMKRALLVWDAEGKLVGETKVITPNTLVSIPVQLSDGLYAVVESSDTLTRTRRLMRWTATDTTALDSTVGAKPKMVTFSCVGLALPPLFTADLAWGSHDRTIATTNQSSYVINEREGQRMTKSIRRSITPLPAKPEDASLLYPEGLKVRFGQGRECVVPSKEIGEKVGVAPKLPVVRAISYAPDGTLWVERYRFENQTPATDVFDRDGRYLGTVNNRALPLGFLGPDIILFAIKNEEDDTTVIGMFRIER